MAANGNDQQLIKDLVFFQRPLDRYLQPLATKLRLRQDLYNDPATPEEQAVLLVEQACDARAATMKKTMLTKAVDTLEPSYVKVLITPITLITLIIRITLIILITLLGTPRAKPRTAKTAEPDLARHRKVGLA